MCNLSLWTYGKRGLMHLQKTHTWNLIWVPRYFCVLKKQNNDCRLGTSLALSWESECALDLLCRGTCTVILLTGHHLSLRNPIHAGGCSGSWWSQHRPRRAAVPPHGTDPQDSLQPNVLHQLRHRRSFPHRGRSVKLGHVGKVSSDTLFVPKDKIYTCSLSSPCAPVYS